MDNIQPHDQDSVNKTNNNSSTYLCRQSSTRWTPTTDQIRILKELYYNNGIRSPTADQIQRIAARLRHYGKIEGKNVFYWFQNHKARERQKKRFTPAAPPPPTPSLYSDHQHMQIQGHHMPSFYNHQPMKRHAASAHHILQPESGGSSSQAFLPVGCNYGAITMEKSFRDCSISPGENMVPGGELHNFCSWARVDSGSFYETKPENETAEEDDGGGELSRDIETLPLFPIPSGSATADFFKMNESVSSEHSNGGFYTGGNWYRSDGLTSLELSLNSYGYYE